MFDFTAKDISEAFQVSMPKARAIAKVCKLWYDSPSYDYLIWLDNCCGAFGVESIKENSQTYPELEIDFKYLNTGDTYSTTLIFSDPKYGPKEVLIGSWGGYIEDLELEYYNGLEKKPRFTVCSDCGMSVYFEEQGSTNRLESLRNELSCPNCWNGHLHY